jgi:hypothetical protein
MSFDIRDYRGGDEAAIVRVWNRSLPQDPISPEVFRARVLLDPSFRPEDARVAWQGDELIGFALAVARRLPLAGSELESEQEGIHNLWFLWTGETSPAGQLYLKAGFTVTRKFHVMRRELA